jgi:cobalt-zinc-cadmium resistance protein CzcA
MLDRLIRLALAHRLAVVVVTLAIAATGVGAFQQLKLEAYPDLSDTGVVVITLYPGFAAEEVEQQVTVPIERALNNTPTVIARRSRTIFGLSVVEVTFADGTGDYFARQVVLERLRDATLPDGVTPTLGPLIGGISEFYRYTLEGPFDAMQLREIQDWVVTPRLLQVPGVADVAPFGGRVRQYEIEIDPRALDKYRLSVRQIAEAVKNNNRNAGGALMELGQQSLAIRGSGLIRSNDDIETIVIDAQKGVPIFVRDIGRVRVGALPQTGIFQLNRQRDRYGSVEGIVLMRRGENPSEVLGAIHDAVAELNRGRLPQNVRLVAIHDKTELVKSTLRTISRVLLEGFVIVVTVLLLFLLSVRAALLTALTIPFSLLFAFVCMRFTGVSMSLLSIGALDFGIIVDATIVMVERIIHSLADRQAEGVAPNGTFERVRAAAHDVQRSILFSLTIIIAAYLPLLTLERVERRLFTPMAMTVCFALLGSLIFSLTLIPALATYVYGPRTRIRRHRVLDWINNRYERLVSRSVRHAGWTVALATVALTLALYLGTHLGTEFLPRLDEGVIWIRAGLPSGISLEKSADVATKMRELILQSPEVRLVASQTGRNDSGTDPFGPNRNELLVDLHPYETWTRVKTKGDLVDELSRRLRGEIPGVAFNFTQPIIDTSTEIATGSSADLAVILTGPDLHQLRSLAQQTLGMLRQVPGAADVSIEQEADQAQLRIAVNRRQTARYGINVSDVQDIIDLTLGGSPITSVFEGDRRFDVVARFIAEARADPSAIGNVLVPTRDGARVPLAELADIRIVEGATIIARRENERQVTVRTNIRGRDQGGFVADAQARFEETVKLPAGYRVVWGGQFENLERAQQRLSVIIPITIGIIFVLLFVAFGSALDALLVLLNVPFSLAGGLVALWLRGIHLSVSAAVGFISLFGVAVMAGVLYISEINRRRREPGASLREAVVAGARVQFRPLLIVILVAALGMMPAALARGIGSDIQRPLATVVVGGLTSTLLLTLLALPAVYRLAERFRRPGASP